MNGLLGVWIAWRVERGARRAVRGRWPSCGVSVAGKRAEPMWVVALSAAATHTSGCCQCWCLRVASEGSLQEKHREEGKHDR